MTVRRKIFFVCLFLFAALFSDAQPFAGEIAEFKKQDSVSFPPPNAVLFVGSSSFRMWKDVQDHFPGHVIINRGFGGSTLLDVTRYANDIILPYKPKQVLIYCGENDFAASDSLNPAQLAQRFIDLFKIIRGRYRKVPIAYVSMKPSPSRKHLMEKFDAANMMIKEFLAKKRRTAFIDVYHAMLKEDGTPMTDIFLGDNLHMNAKGYAIWQQLIEPHLLK